MIRTCAAGWLSVFLSCFAHAQTPLLHAIEPLPLEITYWQTTTLLFPYAIQSVDRGSAQILAQQAKGVKNILQLKAARRHFPSTNLSVVTSDGQFYSFVIEYAEHPSVLSLEVAPNTKGQLAAKPVPADTLAAIAGRIQAFRPHVHVGTRDQLLGLRLRNVCMDSSSLWFSFDLTNRSGIPFAADRLRFYIKEKKQPRRTAVQEKYLTPLYTDALHLIFAFTPFTIKCSQRFYVQVGERSGARLLTLPIRYKTLLKARAIP